MAIRSVKAEMTNLDSLIEFVQSEAVNVGFSGIKLNHILLACEEVLVNIISYAYQGSDEIGKMEVGCHELEDKRGLLITISDSGMPFNPMEKLTPTDIGLAVEDRTIGGLGIHMVKKTMDELSFRRENGDNILSMTKYL